MMLAAHLSRAQRRRVYRVFNACGILVVRRERCDQEGVRLLEKRDLDRTFAPHLSRSDRRSLYRILDECGLWLIER